MAPHERMLLLVLLLVASFDTLLAKGKFDKNRNTDVIPRRPMAPPRQPVLALEEYHVEIHNDLEMFLLDTHCFSKDNDLGLHVLFPDDQQNWSFKDNLLETTKFHCILEWERGYLDFEAFNGQLQFLGNNCGNSTCVWSARQDGMYLTDKNNQFVFNDYWDMLRK